MPDKSKFERALDEILEKSEDKKPSKRSKRRQFEPFSTNVPKTKTTKTRTPIRVNPGNLIIVGVIVIAIAAFTSVATLPLAITGIAMMIIGYALWFKQGNQLSGGIGWRGGDGQSSTTSKPAEPEVKYWRGQRIEEKPESPPTPDLDEPNDRGKIIEFGSPPDDQDNDKK